MSYINLVFQVSFLKGTCGVQGNQPCSAAEKKTVKVCALKIGFYTTILNGIVYKGLIHALKRERKNRGKAALSFTASVVAVATFDGCVCQEERLCSLMKAMPAINYLLQVCVCVCL